MWRKLASKLSVVFTKRGEKKTEIAHKKENYCQIEIDLRVLAHDTFGSVGRGNVHFLNFFARFINSLLHRLSNIS